VIERVLKGMRCEVCAIFFGYVSSTRDITHDDVKHCRRDGIMATVSAPMAPVLHESDMHLAVSAANVKAKKSTTIATLSDRTQSLIANIEPSQGSRDG
jgi:hypothetical protein